MARRVFTTEFKESAVRLASAPGAVVEDVAHELGIAAWTLRRWMKAQIGTSRRGGPRPAPVPPPQPDLLARVRELEAENARLRMERDILKQATVFFAAEDQKHAQKHAGGKERP
jgi:transposase